MRPNPLLGELFYSGRDGVGQSRITQNGIILEDSRLWASFAERIQPFTGHQATPPKNSVAPVTNLAADDRKNSTGPTKSSILHIRRNAWRSTRAWIFSGFTVLVSAVRTGGKPMVLIRILNSDNSWLK